MRTNTSQDSIELRRRDRGDRYITHCHAPRAKSSVVCVNRKLWMWWISFCINTHTHVEPFLVVVHANKMKNSMFNMENDKRMLKLPCTGNAATKLMLLNEFPDDQVQQWRFGNFPRFASIRFGCLFSLDYSRHRSNGHSTDSARMSPQTKWTQFSHST